MEGVWNINIMAKKLYIEDGEIYPAVVYSETAPIGSYTDYTNDLEKWDQYGLGARMNSGIPMQYKQMRDIIEPIVYSKIGASLENWGTVSQEVREIACKYIFVPYSIRTTIFSDEQDKANFEILYYESGGFERDKLKGRRRIIQEMKALVAIDYLRTDVITMVDVEDFVTTTSHLVDAYLEFSSYKFFQWLTNAVGTAYELDGFAQKSYYSVQLKEDLVLIYQGDY